MIWPHTLYCMVIGIIKMCENKILTSTSYNIFTRTSVEFRFLLFWAHCSHDTAYYSYVISHCSLLMAHVVTSLEKKRKKKWINYKEEKKIKNRQTNTHTHTWLLTFFFFLFYNRAFCECNHVNDRSHG